MKQIRFLLIMSLMLLAAVQVQAVEPLSGKFTVNTQGKQVQFASENIGPYSWDDANANIPTGWRLLTNEEWAYLLREEDPMEGYGPMNAGQATVGTQHGLVILPDNWTGELSFKPSPNIWTTNSYTESQWNMMEGAGAVFLPCEGEMGNYWSASPNGESNAYAIHFYEQAIQADYSAERSSSYAVRLVKDVSTTPTGVEDVQRDDVRCTKVLRDGQIYLMYKGTMYNVQGKAVNR